MVIVTVLCVSTPTNTYDLIVAPWSKSAGWLAGNITTLLQPAGPSCSGDKVQETGKTVLKIFAGQIRPFPVKGRCFY